MLFQGQEFAASSPFLYFADHYPELAKKVTSGRKQFLRQFPSTASLEAQKILTASDSREIFHRCRLNFAERERHADIYALHRDLLKLRHTDPVFHRPNPRGLDGAVLAPHAFVLRYFGAAEGDRLLLLNLGNDLHLDPAPEPLLAPLQDHLWKLLWSSENPRYGGNGTPRVETAGNWHVPANSAMVFTPVPGERKLALQHRIRKHRRTA
jgi:maltooligosyltrehalose trehalohydrolase